MQNGEEKLEEKKLEPDDLEQAVHDLMDEYDLDEGQAKKVERLENEGYDEEDAVSQALDS